MPVGLYIFLKIDIIVCYLPDKLKEDYSGTRIGKAAVH